MIEDDKNKVSPIAEVTFDEHLAEQISDPDFALGFLQAALIQGKDCFYDALKLVLEARRG